jgi:uncharacterized protein involved in oxidation of intracellular sulfur
MKYLFVLHDSPYGTERTYNALRWARQMLRKDAEHDVRVFLFGDAVVSVHSDQRTPNGYYNVGTMLQDLTENGAQVGSCGSCMDARGISGDRLVKGCHRSSMVELSEWTDWSDRPINV